MIPIFDMLSLSLPTLALLAAPAQGGNPMVALLIQFGLIFAIFYFLMIRPQQKQRKQHEEALRNLRKGDEITTAGGIVGEVVHIAHVQPVVDGVAPRSMEDRVTIRSGESRLIVERGRIARITSRTTETVAP